MQLLTCSDQLHPIELQSNVPPHSDKSPNKAKVSHCETHHFNFHLLLNWNNFWPFSHENAMWPYKQTVKKLEFWRQDVLEPSFSTRHWKPSSISTDGLVDLLAEAVKKSKVPLEEKMDALIVKFMRCSLGRLEESTGNTFGQCFWIMCGKSLSL